MTAKTRLVDAVKAVVDLNGGIASFHSGDAIMEIVNPPKFGDSFSLIPTDNTALWITDKTAALVVAVDSTVLFNGLPTIKVTIPAGTSGTCSVGMNTAGARTPYGWDGTKAAWALKHTGFTGYTWSGSSYPPTVAMYLGDASYTNFWTMSENMLAYPEQKWREGDWGVFRKNTWSVGGGSPAMATTMRMKLQWTQVSQVTDCTIHIGLVGVMPAKEKATFVLTVDDGYDEWYTFLAPLLKHYKIPVSMGLSQSQVGTAGYMTAAQVQELYTDNSKLFDFVNHSYDNTPYSTLGASEAYTRIVAMRDYMRGTLGIETDGPLHVPYVQSSWGRDLADLLSAGGFLSGRSNVNAGATYGMDQLIHTGDDWLRWNIYSRINLGSGTNLAAAQAALDSAITAKDLCFVMGHEFGTSSNTYKWTMSDMEQFMGYVASKVAAGTLEVKSWSRWYSDLTGRQYSRP